MRLPRFRFRLRGLMVAVALIGLLLGGWLTLERRRVRFEDLANAHGKSLGNYKIVACMTINFHHDDAGCEAFRRGGHLPSPNGQHDFTVCSLTAHDHLWTYHHYKMGEKYRLAAQRPWLPVAPDPPPPPGPDRPDPDPRYAPPGPGPDTGPSRSP